jgi:uncharacterized tellurite resistance protein B-like protein
MSFVKRFLGIEPRDAGPAPGSTETETETVRKIVDALDKLEPQRARYIAAFAYILSRVAHSDRKISSDETGAMERIVVERGGLPEEQAMVVVQMAKTQSLLFGGTENYLVTREFNRIAERDQKLALLDCLYSVAAVDQSIVSAEDTEIRKISGELGLSHGDFVSVKSRYREHIEALKKPRVPPA